MGHGPTGSLDESLKGSSEKFSQDREAFGSCPTEKFSLTDSCFLPSEDTTSNERSSRKEGSKIEVTYRQSRRKTEGAVEEFSQAIPLPTTNSRPRKEDAQIEVNQRHSHHLVESSSVAHCNWLIRRRPVLYLHRKIEVKSVEPPLLIILQNALFSSRIPSQDPSSIWCKCHQKAPLTLSNFVYKLPFCSNTIQYPVTARQAPRSAIRRNTITSAPVPTMPVTRRSKAKSSSLMAATKASVARASGGLASTGAKTNSALAAKTASPSASGIPSGVDPIATALHKDATLATTKSMEAVDSTGVARSVAGTVAGAAAGTAAGTATHAFTPPVIATAAVATATAAFAMDPTLEANSASTKTTPSVDESSAQATDAFAAEALDATDGAFLTVDDAIEAGLASVTPCGADLDPMTPSGFDSHAPSVDSSGRKPGFHTMSKASLAMHIQAPADPSTVSPSGIDVTLSTAVDDPSTARASGGGVRIVTDAQATDALAAEALDATDGAFPPVADAVAAANFGSSIDDIIEDAVDIQTCGKPGLQLPPEAPLGTHTQASDAIEAANFGSGVDANVVEYTVKSAGATTSGGGSGAQVMETRLASVSPSVSGSASQPDAPSLESGSRPSAVSTLRREPHPFLTTENANVYTQDPQMEGLTMDIDDEYQSEIQSLPWNVFLTPRERGPSLQDEYLVLENHTEHVCIPVEFHRKES